jgi:hypothetical protein
MRISLAFVLLLAACGSDNNNADGSAGPDMAAPAGDMKPPPPICDEIKMTGCMSGQHCTVGSSNGTPGDVCIPNPASPIPEGGDCQAVQLGGPSLVGDNCTPGTACISFLGISKCRKFCYFHEDCASGAVCSVPTDSGNSTTDPFMQPVPLEACITGDNCDAIKQTGCPTGQRCLISRGDEDRSGLNTYRVTVCGMATGNAAPGASCQASSDCQPGYRCGGLGFCRQLCYPNMLPDAGVGSTCAIGGDCTPIPGTNNVYGECDGT